MASKIQQFPVPEIEFQAIRHGWVWKY